MKQPALSHAIPQALNAFDQLKVVQAIEASRRATTGWQSASSGSALMRTLEKGRAGPSLKPRQRVLDDQQP